MSAYALKIVAILGMTACHVGYVFDSTLPFPLACVLKACGGVTFPIMAFLLVEGYRHTSSVRRYAARLLVFALIAQIPYWFTLGWQGNVLFTLLLGLGLMALYDATRRERIPRSAFLLVTIAALAASLLLDWGFIGPIMILLMHSTRGGLRGSTKSAVQAITAPLAVASLGLGIPSLGAFLADDWSALPDVIYALAAIPAAGFLLSRYRGTRGKPLKWFFYLYYPAHLAVLGTLKFLIEVITSTGSTFIVFF